MLAHASGIDEEDLLDLLEEAQGASVLCEVQEVAGRYRFAHALIAHTLATDMGPTRRARAHRTVAGALEALWEGELGPDALDDQVLVGLERTASAKKAGRLRQLAHHYALTAQAADHPRALAYCRLAGHAALGALAPDEATGWFAKALELYHADGPTDQALGTDLLIGLGTAQRHAGDPENRATLLGAARQAQAHGEAQALTRAVLTACDGALSTALGYLDAEKVACLEAAIAALGPEDSAAKAALLGRAVLGAHLRGSPGAPTGLG